MRKALINPQSKIVDIRDSEFPVHPSLMWRDCPDETRVDWTFDPEAGVFSSPEAPRAGDEEKLSAVELRRWKTETGGVTFDGLTIPTRDRDKTLILGKIVSLDRQNAPDTDEFNFVLGGQTITITAGQIRDIGVLIEQHVQKTVDAQDQVVQNVSSYATIEDAIAAYDAAFAAL